ncbi:FHA domain-containing protein [Candidatus Parcubacteria bacterium]|nr:MAG: FHA domain-containing protein [Candidatus Parcubacteria bacterium]
MKIVRKIVFLLLVLILLANVPPAFSQTVINQVFITSVDYSQFPDISALVRVVGENRAPIANLKVDDLRVMEDDTPVEFSLESVRVGVKVAIVLDMGAGLQYDGATRVSQFDEMRSVVKDFLDTMDEKDGVELITVYEDSTSVLVPMTSDKNALLDAVDNLKFTRTEHLSNGLDGVVRAIGDLNKASGVSTPLVVLLVTPGIQSTFSGEQTKYSDVSRLLDTVDIPIHTVLLVRPGQQPQLLQELVTKSRAQFVRYTSRDSAKALIDLIDAQRWQYRITYRTTSGSAAERTLKVAARTETGAPPFDVEKFTVLPEPQPPAVLSMTINNGDPVTRTAPSYDSDLTGIPLTEAKIDVQVYWPDGFSHRKIVRAELFVDGQPHGEPLLDLENVDTLSFTWDLRTYTNKGKTTSRVQVVLTDELGLQSIEELQVPVEVFVPDKPEPTPIVVAAGTDICESLNSLPYAGESLYSACQKWGITPAQMLNMLIALAALVMVVIIWVNREKVQEKGRAIADGITRAWESITRPKAVAKAKLVAIAGIPDNEVKEFEIFGDTRIGRHPEFTDLCFQQNKENSVISREHCKIQEDENNPGHWFIIDRSSSYGTFLNGKKLHPMKQVPLRDGDEFDVGPTAMGGIRFKFINLVPEDEIVESADVEYGDDDVEIYTGTNPVLEDISSDEDDNDDAWNF